MESNFFSKENYELSDLQKLIADGVEESLTLEYKSARALENIQKQKHEIAKDISALANSSGGIIIYGMEEDNHKPTEISFVDASNIDRERLENVIVGNIHRKINGLQIFPIQNNGNPAETVYLIKVPESTDAPHMSSDNKYYKRHNFKVLSMEEYEVRRRYLQPPYSEVSFGEIISLDVPLRPKTHELVPTREISVYVKNNSNTMVHHCKLDIQLVSETAMPKLDYVKISSFTEKYFANGPMIFSAYNDSPIFPGETHCIMKFELSTPNGRLDKLNDSVGIKAVLYNPTSISERYYSPSELWTKRR